jgi:hypothetical protein
MLVPMKRQEFDLLDHTVLVWACIEPAIQRIHSGMARTEQVSAQLSNGQKILLMFRYLYDHIGVSRDDFYAWMSHVLTETQRWSGVKRSLSFIGDEAMAELLEETESLLKAWEQQKEVARSLASDNGAVFLAALDRLNARFHEVVPGTIALLARYIRNNPGEFVQFEDEALSAPAE